MVEVHTHLVYVCVCVNSHYEKFTVPYSVKYQWIGFDKRKTSSKYKLKKKAVWQKPLPYCKVISLQLK